MSRKYTREEIIAKAREVWGDKYEYGEYLGYNTKMKIVCPIHGEFEQTPHDHIGGHGCQKCFNDRRGKNRQMNTEQFIEKAKAKYGDSYDYSMVNYVDSKTKVKIKCNTCGHVFEQRPAKHLNANGCPKCAQKKRNASNIYTTEDFIKQAKLVHGDKYDYSKYNYINSKTPSTIICKLHGEFEQSQNAHITAGHGCPKCVDHRSKWETSVYEYIASLGVDIEQSNRELLNGKEIDVYIPEKMVGVECDGLLWHNERTCDKNYHINKTNEANDKGVRLIHIFEDEWKYKKDIVKGILSNILGKTRNKIYARSCEVRLVSPSEKKMFIDSNHIQGDVKSSVNLGLYYNDELISTMTFGKPRISMKGDRSDGNWELIRFCNKIGYNVIGGASKMLKYFQQNYDYNRIISYCDKRWFDGKMYEKLGFTHDHDSKPNYFYVINDRRKNRFQFRKDVLVKEGYDPAKTEHQIMLDRGIYRIYDCGTKVYFLENQSKNINPL